MFIDRLFISSKLGRKMLIHYFSKKEGGVYRSSTVRHLFEKHRKITAGYGSYGWTSDLFDGPATIGNYTSIGKNVRRISVNHLFKSATTHPCLFSPAFGWVKQDTRERTNLLIGNDVWIGDNVIILPSCSSIGNGAIVAAGAVVSKDIPPFEIWGGVPARFIKKRFPAEIENGLEEVKWWNLPEEQLKILQDKFEDPFELIETIRRM